MEAMMARDNCATRIGQLSIMMLLTIGLSNICMAQSRLSPEGQRMQAAHAFLFNQLIKNRETKITGDKPQYLRRVLLSKQEHAIDGPTDVPLDEGAEKVLPMFRYIELTGEGLDGLGTISLLPGAPETALPVSTHTPSVYRVKLPALTAPKNDEPRAAIRLRGKGVIHTVSLVSFGGGISDDFDSAPYRNLGEEFAPEQVEVRIDTLHELSIEGHIEIDRSKWFRYYGNPNGVPRSMEQYAADRGFVPGRQIFKFEPALEKGYSPNQPLLHENPQRPGWCDPTFFQQYKSDQFANGYGPFADTPFAMCFNDYPSFMAVKHTGRGTPLPQHFDAAADLVAQFLKNQIQHSGRTATYWELKNESTIKAEWDFHFEKDVDSWGLLSEFHNTVADHVHKEVPGVKIGGPASAWMQIQVGDFKLWRDQQRFMDETRGHMDFYSHHFYEDMGTLGAFEKRGRGYRNYLLGRLEAILDMFQAHMHGTDNVRPILLTEYGALNVGKSEADYWLRLRSYSAFMTRLMQRPEQIEMAVPFIFLASHWDPQNGHSVFVPHGARSRSNDLDDYRKTANGYFLELWRDFRGRRLPVRSDQPWLSVVAVHDGKTVRVALSNMGGRRLEVSLSDLAGMPIGSSMRQRRLHYLDGQVVFDDDITRENSERVLISPEETTVVELSLAEPLRPKNVTHRHSWYAADTAVRSSDGERVEFKVTVDKAVETQRAVLFIGIQRNGGLSAPLSGTINGYAFQLDNQSTRKVPQLFECLTVDVPVEQVRNLNTIRIDGQPGLTLTSVRIETFRER